ncbi:MAG: energy transducer TonB [Gemmatimonadaceae bacterium]
MFKNLIESKPKKQRSLGGSIASTIFHLAIIGLSVIATANAGSEPEEEIVQKVDFIEVKKDEPPPPDKPPPPPDVLAPPPIAKGFQVLSAPVNIPDVIPEIDLSKALTNEDDFSGRGVAGGLASGVVGGTVVNTDQTYFDFQVEKPVAALPGGVTPRYPDILRAGGVEGEVLATFEVDTTGRVVISSFKVLRKSHDLFEAAVRSALPQMRFLPAEIGGRKVRQLVQQPFAFTLQR